MEYGLIGALVLVVSIAVITTLGQNLNGLMQGLKADMKSHTGTTQTTGSTGSPTN